MAPIIGHPGVIALSDELARKRVGLVYFLRAGDFVKIGYTNNLDRRMTDLRTGMPLPIELIGVRIASRLVEGELHRRFEHLRTFGEWFVGEAELLAEARLPCWLDQLEEWAEKNCPSACVHFTEMARKAATYRRIRDLIPLSGPAWQAAYAVG